MNSITGKQKNVPRTNPVATAPGTVPRAVASRVDQVQYREP